MHHSHFNTIHSTQIYLRDNLTELKTHSDDILISASEQTLGIGRRGNQWDSYNNSLAMSFTLKPHATPTLTPIEIGILTALFVEKELNLSLKLKWPNDLLTPAGTKCGGIIAQYIDSETVIAGLGLNLGDTHHQHTPAHYKHGLGSVNPELHLSTEDFKDIPHKLYDFFLNNRIQEGKALEELFLKYCLHINSPVALDDDGQTIEGIFIGIGNNGEAIVEINGEKQSFLSSSLKILSKN
jgi:BirA family transcriptional regulator, biotin operon repressor / biotin---[acetyl-CoA-carboxylase] ligase